MLDPTYMVAGAFTGFFVGMTGVGAGALMTPILLLFFGVSPTTAVATDLWFASITKLLGVSLHSYEGNVDWQIVRRLWAGSLPMAILVVFWGSLVCPIDKIAPLNILIGTVVLLTGLGLFVSPKIYAIVGIHSVGFLGKFRAAQPVLTILLGAVLGILVAITSVGAGALGSVILLSLYPLRMSAHRLVATDLAHAIPLTTISGIGYFFIAEVDWNLLLCLLIGSIPAVFLGALVARKTPSRWLRYSLSAVLLLAGWRLVASG